MSSNAEANVAPTSAVQSAAAPVIDRLRPYQKRDYRDVLSRCEKVRSVLYVAFMGSGKTVLAAAVVRTWVARGERILILTHTREILRQTHEKLLAAGIDEKQIGWIWRQHARTNVDAPIQLASLDTLVRRELPQGITRLVIDEAHHATAKKWRNVLDAYPNARVLGLTGTPVRLDGQPLGTVFDEMIESEPVESLIDQGWIARPSYWTPTWHVELPRRSGDDFGDLVAAEMIPHARVLESMVAEYTKHAVGLPALGFAATREKAIQYAAHFAASGIAADTLFGLDTDLKRQGTLARLRKGTLRVLWTCNVLGEGWDYPGLRCVMLARPTLSIARYLQQVARCMRPGTSPVVLDLWGAWRVFDPPWADFGWNLQTRARTSRHVGERGVTGEVTWLPPVEVKGRLIRADASMRAVCVVCGGPAAHTSSLLARRLGTKPHCEKHARGKYAKKPRLPCCVCGEPSTGASSSAYRVRGTNPRCTKHASRWAGWSKPSLPCAVCSEPATPASSYFHAKLGKTEGYCAEHARGVRPLLSCTVCGEPATRKSSSTARREGTKAYCTKHKSTYYAGPLLSCAMCGKPATRSSSQTARYKNTKAYCVEHIGGPRATLPLLSCAMCGKPATRKSSTSARSQGNKAYCAEHRMGPVAPRPLLSCAVCGGVATRTSSNASRRLGIKAYCVEHTGSRKGPK